jgi:ribosomal protein S12 methylthiotransferase
LYLYPDLLTLHQLKKLTSFRKFIPYFDIPLQHSASTVLQRMGRFYDEQAIHDFLQCIQTEFPVHFIRTNFIIGFPGETEEEFQHLQSFIQKDYFDNIALFEYHDEPLAKSSQFPNQIPEKLIRSRFRLLRSLINQLFLARSASRKGKEERGYVQSITTHRGVNLLTVRPRLHSPEMDEVDDVVRDHIISVEGETLQVGSKVKYRV